MNVKGRIYVGVAAYTVARGVANPGFMILYPLYVLSLGYKVSDVGVLATYSTLLASMVLPGIGYFVDRGYARFIGFLSGIMVSISLIMPPLFKGNYYVLILSYAFYILGMFTWHPSRNYIVSNVFDRASIGRVFSTFLLLFNITRIVTSYTIGFLSEALGYAKLMLYFSLVSVLGSAVFYVASKEPYKPKVNIRLNIGVARIIRETYGFSKELLPLIIFSVLDRFAWQLWFPLLNAFLRDYHSFSDITIGLFNGLFSTSMLLLSYASGYVTDRIGYIRALVIYEIIGALGTVILCFTGIFTFIAAVFLGFSVALWVPAFNTATSFIKNPSFSGKVRSSVDSLRLLFSIPAPLIGGVLYSIFKFLPFTLGALIMLIAPLAFRMSSKRNQVFS